MRCFLCVQFVNKKLTFKYQQVFCACECMQYSSERETEKNMHGRCRSMFAQSFLFSKWKLWNIHRNDDNIQNLQSYMCDPTMLKLARIHMLNFTPLFDNFIATCSTGMLQSILIIEYCCQSIITNNWTLLPNL